MRFRKRPKIIEAIAVVDILDGEKFPEWLGSAIKAGKVQRRPHTINIVIGRQVKTAFPEDWIAYDTEQAQVYCVTKRTMEADYELAEYEDPGPTGLDGHWTT